MPGLPITRTFVASARVSESACDLPTLDLRIQRALTLLQSQTAQIDEIALNLNLSDSRFRHLFKKEVGVSPTRYRRLMQLEKAKDLLTGSFLRVKEVVGLVDGRDLSHFVRDFKKRYGKTPSQARKKLRGNLIV